MKKFQQLRSKEVSTEQFKIYINPVNKYQMGQLIGTGPHGSVCEALSMTNGEQVAIKKVLCTREHIDTIKYYLQKKLLDIDHFNLVNYIEIEEFENGEINIVSELISGSSLESVLNLFGKLKENVCKLFIEQILKGLEHLHKKGSYHGNLKPRNVFIDKNGKVKLGDFFIISRKMMSSEVKNLKNKPICYLSPEYIKDQSKSSKTDIWALGCILLEMLTKEKPWKHNYCNLTFMKEALLNNKTPEIPKNLSELCKNFIKKMLKIKEEERASIEELLNHPFIRLKEDDGDMKMEMSKEFKMSKSFHPVKSPNKKDFAKSKTNQHLLFVKMKTSMENNKEKQEEIPDKKIKINLEEGSKLSTGNLAVSLKISNRSALNPNKMYMRMTTAEIRKKNEEERKKFEEELMMNFNDET